MEEEADAHDMRIPSSTILRVIDGILVATKQPQETAKSLISMITSTTADAPSKLEGDRAEQSQAEDGLLFSQWLDTITKELAHEVKLT
ncbi:hypothetical protein FZEAL_9662 [Fusarium zealandicum]|uniref:Uncharacterized protein n=1 Tax=Fusarium zealandicum TaxID=1053134 RepID=A0A8H4U9P1_9HYPO|nr:hypothetical protein FZEAL_9662 [Fusarium zealandicum]